MASGGGHRQVKRGRRLEVTGLLAAAAAACNFSSLLVEIPNPRAIFSNPISRAIDIFSVLTVDRSMRRTAAVGTGRRRRWRARRPGCCRRRRITRTRTRTGPPAECPGGTGWAAAAWWEWGGEGRQLRPRRLRPARPRLRLWRTRRLGSTILGGEGKEEEETDKRDERARREVYSTIYYYYFMYVFVWVTLRRALILENGECRQAALSVVVRPGPSSPTRPPCLFLLAALVAKNFVFLFYAEARSLWRSPFFFGVCVCEASGIQTKQEPNPPASWTHFFFFFSPVPVMDVQHKCGDLDARDPFSCGVSTVVATTTPTDDTKTRSFHGSASCPHAAAIFCFGCAALGSDGFIDDGGINENRRS